MPRRALPGQPAADEPALPADRHAAILWTAQGNDSRFTSAARQGAHVRMAACTSRQYHP